MKRAQTEVFGLVVIVLLLSVGLLFAIGFMAKKEPISFRKQFIQTEISYNLLEAILETTVVELGSNCHNLRITELIQDCYENQYDLLYCNGDNSCEYAETLINNTLLRNTLDKWDYTYQLTVTAGDVTPVDVIPTLKNSPCEGERKAVTYILPTNMEDIEVKLYLCG